MVSSERVGAMRNRHVEGNRAGTEGSHAGAEPKTIGVFLPEGTEAIVCADIARRAAFGLGKYGVTVAANPLELREWLEHQYMELLDAAIYCRRAMAELDAKDAGHG